MLPSDFGLEQRKNVFEERTLTDEFRSAALYLSRKYPIPQNGRTANVWHTTGAPACAMAARPHILRASIP